MRSRSLLLLGFLAVAACGPELRVKPIGSRVDPAPPPTPPPPPGAEAALPPLLPGGWHLAGGPADYTPATVAETLKDEAGRFRGLKSYAVAEYVNLGQRVVSLEAFAMTSPDAAAAALAIGRPKDARAITGDDLDEAFVSGLRAEGRKGALLVRVKWFEEKDNPLSDSALEAMRDSLASGVKAGLSAPAVAAATASPAGSIPAASPTPSAASKNTPAPTPTH